MSNHTPGPWHVTAGHRSIRPSFISPGENGGFAICEMYADGRDFTANARLIAAAPELLEAAYFGHCDSLDFPAGDLLAAANVLRNSGCADLAERLEMKHQMEMDAIAKARGDA